MGCKTCDQNIKSAKARAAVFHAGIHSANSPKERIFQLIDKLSEEDLQRVEAMLCSLTAQSSHEEEKHSYGLSQKQF